MEVTGVASAAQNLPSSFSHHVFSYRSPMQSTIYSVGWVQLVFSSRTVTEELLLPEREGGNLTYADYEKAINFLPRAKQYAYRPVCRCPSPICLLLFLITRNHR